ncbi:MAG: hypothetical protein NXH79_06840 [Rhodobacteraceae bacterium]|nr:hypothetical protein [Paracoccaceae bacterium]
MLIGFGIGGLAILATCLWVIAFSPSLHKRAVCAGLLAVTAIAGGWLTTVSPQARLHHVAVLCDSPDHRRYVGPAHPDCHAAQSRAAAFLAESRDG